MTPALRAVPSVSNVKHCVQVVRPLADRQTGGQADRLVV